MSPFVGIGGTVGSSDIVETPETGVETVGVLVSAVGVQAEKTRAGIRKRSGVNFGFIMEIDDH